MTAPIAISSDSELKALFARLVDDIVNAGGYLRLHKLFSTTFETYRDEVNQTPGFWSFTEAAVREASLFRLSRIYDQDKRALSLSTLLHTIAHHTEYFCDDAVLKRVSESYAEEFKPGSHEIDRQQLEKDIVLVSASDPLVKKLVVWRGNYGAHVSHSVVLKPSNAFSGISRDELFVLVERAFTIYNRYLTSFEACSYSTMIIGEDSNEFLFKLLRIGLQKFRDDTLGPYT